MHGLGNKSDIHLPKLTLLADVAFRTLSLIPADTKCAAEKKARREAVKFIAEFLTLRPGQKDDMD